MPRRLIALLLLFACHHRPPAVDPLEVDLHRARISKVRHAIAETRSVLASTVGEAHQPELYMRLAELTSEEARHHYLVALERQQGRAEALHLPQVRLLKEQAIGTYRALLTKWPSAELADNALFAIGQEQRELGRIDEMTATLAELLRRFPRSPFRGEALLLLGNHHFDDARFTPAAERYTQLLALDDPRLNGMAHYKLAWVHVNQGACEEAVGRFQRALLAERHRAEREGPVAPTGRWASDDRGAFAVPAPPSAPGDAAADDALDVSREALVDVTYCYAQVGDPKRAVAYLRRWAPSRSAYVAALVKMAQRYATVEQPLGAASVARELLRLGPDAPARIDDGRLLHSALTQTEDFSRVGDDVRVMLEVAGRRRMAPELTVDQREQLTREFEGLTRDLLLRAHRMAEDGGTSEWTDRPFDRDQTIRGYQAWLATFPHAEDAGDLHANAAELLLDAGRPLQAARHFEAADRAWTDQPEQAAEARYNAAFAYQSALAGGDARSRVEVVQARAGLRRAGGAWLATAPRGDQARAMAFSIARSYYDEGDHETAVDLLTAVAWAHPRHEEGQAAAMLVLDAHHSLNQLTGLMRAGQRFVAPDSPLPPATRARITPILASAEQRQLDELALAASGDEAGGLSTLMDFVETYEGSDLAERALLSTFVAAQAQGDSEALFEVGAAILDRFPDGEQSAGVASTLGQTATARYEFDRARAWLDRAAHTSADDAQARAILLSLAELEQRLGNPDAAIAACRTALSRARTSTDRAEVFTTLTALVERSFEPPRVVEVLTRFGEAHPELTSLLGLALVQTGRIDEGEGQLAAVASDPSASPRAVARAQLGLAEANLGYLRAFGPSSGLDAIDELIGLVELTVQGYLTAARQPEPDLSLTALLRLATATSLAADKLEAAGLPADLPAADRKLLAGALEQRIAGLRSGHAEALAECANRARASFLVGATGRACLRGELPSALPVDPIPQRPRRPAAPAVDGARDRLAANPSDLDALRELGRAHLAAGDAHAARMAFAAAVAEGGQSEDLVALADAHRALGDRVAAAEALGRAHGAGHAPATEALTALLVELGLSDEAARLEADGE